MSIRPRWALYINDGDYVVSLLLFDKGLLTIVLKSDALQGSQAVQRITDKLDGSAILQLARRVETSDDPFVMSRQRTQPI